jgi:hypothetical protein
MRRALLGLALLAFLPVASAAPGLVAHIESASLTAAGRGHAAAPLGALVVAAPREREGGPDPAAGAFLLRADDLGVEVDRHAYQADTPATTTPEGTMTTHREPYGRAQVRSHEPRQAYALAVLPLPGRPAPVLEIEWGALSVSAASGEPVGVPNAVNATEARRLDVPGAVLLELAPAQLQTLVVQGDFRLALWFWNVTVESSQSSQATLVWSGERYTPLVSPLGPTQGVRLDVERHQVVLEVVGGVLEFTRLPASTDFYAPAASLSAAATWTHRDAAGALGDGADLRPLAGRHVALVGDLRADAAWAPGARVATTLRGSLEEARLDGQHVAWAAAVPDRVPAPGGRWSTAWWMLMALPAAGLGWNRVRGWREVRRMDALEAAAAFGAWPLAAEEAAWLRGSRSFAADAAAIETEALLRLGRADEARRRLEATPAWAGSRAAQWQFLRAWAAAAMGDPEAAVRDLLEALPAAPELGREVVARSEFAACRRDPRLRTLLGAAVERAPPTAAYA